MTIFKPSIYTLGLFAMFFSALLIFPATSNAADMCGDVTGNGVVDGADLTIYKRTFDNLPPGMTRPDLCDVGGSIGCTEEDLGIMEKYFGGLATLSNQCNVVPQCGDVNFDGLVNDTDANLIFDHVRGLNPDLKRLDLCDVGGGIGCTATDATIIINYHQGNPDAVITQQCFEDRPRIQTIVPAIAKVGDTVSITGFGFTSATRIDVVGKNLTIIPTSFTSTTLTFVVPSSMDVGSYVVRTIEKAGSEEDASYGVGFSVIASPDAPPVVDIKVADVDGPITIQLGDAETLSWTSSNSISCTLSSVDSNGNNTSQDTVLTGLQSTGSLSVSTTFTLTCQTSYGISASDSVTVNVDQSSGFIKSPAIYSVNPFEAKRGDIVTITGVNLNDGTYVEFVGQNLTAVTTASTPTSLSFIVPQVAQIGTNLIEVRKKASDLRSGKTNLVVVASQDTDLQTSMPAPIVTSPPITTTTDKLFTRNLWHGVRNDDVRRLQGSLAQDATLYPEGITSGYYGSLTEAAVKRFQCKYNIVCSGTSNSTGYGVVGPRTREKLNEVYLNSSGAGALLNSQTSTGNQGTNQSTSGSSGLSQFQIDSIVSLLEAFGAGASVIADVRAVLQ